MPTERQLALQRRRITPSKMAAIMGLIPQHSPADIYYQIVEGMELPETDAMEVGKDLERPLLDWAARQPLLAGHRLRRNVRHVHPRYPKLFSTVTDADDLTEEQLLEGKTTGINYPMPIEARSQWGEELTDQVPERVIIQVQFGLAHLPDWPRGIVAAWIGGRGRCLFILPRNNELIGMLEEAGLKFQRDHIDPKRPPTDRPPSMEVLRHIRREPNKIVPVDMRLFRAYRNTTAGATEMQKRARELKERLIASLGDAEAGDPGTGELVTYYEQSSKAYVVPARKGRVIHVVKDRRRLTDGGPRPETANPAPDNGARGTAEAAPHPSGSAGVGPPDAG